MHTVQSTSHPAAQHLSLAIPRRIRSLTHCIPSLTSTSPGRLRFITSPSFPGNSHSLHLSFAHLFTTLLITFPPHPFAPPHIPSSHITYHPRPHSPIPHSSLSYIAIQFSTGYGLRNANDTVSLLQPSLPALAHSAPRGRSKADGSATRELFLLTRSVSAPRAVAIASTPHPVLLPCHPTSREVGVTRGAPRAPLGATFPRTTMLLRPCTGRPRLQSRSGMEMMSTLRLPRTARRTSGQPVFPLLPSLTFLFSPFSPGSLTSLPLPLLPSPPNADHHRTPSKSIAPYVAWESANE